MSIQQGIINIRRSKQFVGSAAIFIVEIDRTEKAQIKGARRVSIETPTGKHTLRVRNSETQQQSNEVLIDVYPGQTQDYEFGYNWFTQLVLRQDTNVEVISSKQTTSAGEINSSINERGVFISYRRSDSADIAGRIYDRLVSKFGKEPIFKDVDSIPLGVDFKEYLGDKVSECSVLLAVIGDHWVNAKDASGKKRLDDPADFVRIEIESALEREIPVIPLMVRDAKMPVESDLPVSLQKLVYKNGIQIRPDPDFHRDMDRLISALQRYIQ